MAKTTKGNKWVRVPGYKRGGSMVKGHCRSTPNRKKK